MKIIDIAVAFADDQIGQAVAVQIHDLRGTADTHVNALIIILPGAKGEWIPGSGSIFRVKQAALLFPNKYIQITVAIQITKGRREIVGILTKNAHAKVILIYEFKFRIIYSTHIFKQIQAGIAHHRFTKSTVSTHHEVEQTIGIIIYKNGRSAGTKVQHGIDQEIFLLQCKHRLIVGSRIFIPPDYRTILR